MKGKLLLSSSLLAIFALCGCTPTNNNQSNDSSVISYPDGESVSVDISETPEIPEIDIESNVFSLTTEDGTFTENDGVYTITAAGTYKASGILENGQIIINATKNDEVVLELSNASISCDSDSPIKALKADKLEISAKKNTQNAIYDKRVEKVEDNETVGEGAINAKCDVKLKGTGLLVVEGNYNNGIHTTKDLTIQKQELYVVAVNNALKGKDGISMVSGAVTAISKKGNGLKTDNTDVSSSGKQRGIITLSGGTLFVDSAFDAIDAAYNIVINEENEDSVDTNITIKTGRYSTYSSNYIKNESAKGIKADNNIQIAEGEVVIQAGDDAIHANYGDTFDNGETGLGTIAIDGGTIGIASGDDGIHADNTLSVNGGNITITNALEGLEANHINFNGGEAHIYATDDGVNASNKINEAPTINVTGGFLDIQVASGDTDGIDSNGSYTQTGGLVVSRGSPNNAQHMSTGLDCDDGASISGGTFIAFNGVENTPSTTSNILNAYYGSSQSGPGGPGGPGGPRYAGGSSSIVFQTGTYTLSGGEMNYSFYNQYAYSTFTIYSDKLSVGTSYTLANGEEVVLSWTQNGKSHSIQL